MRAEYNGTLAAARCLSDHGVAVTIAASSRLAPARWSRSAREVRSCPPIRSGPERLVEWLLEFGSRNPKHVLYPTCDDTAWLFAQHHADLARQFHMYSPAAETINTLLDKYSLYAAANAAGIDTPRTWLPQDESELAQIMASGPAFLIKPRTHAFFKPQAKGDMATSLAQLKSLWRRYRSLGFHAEVQRNFNNVRLPIVQQYLPNAASKVCSISGFAIRSGQIISVRASNKLMQLPRRVGVGLCFESAQPDALLVGRLSDLCRQIGYHGVFEAEFVHHEGRALLIDFNPRYFGQMGFDIARGMPLPWLAQLCATGHETEATRHAANTTADSRIARYADSMALKWHLLSGAALGGVSRDERRQWLDWLSSTSDLCVDAVIKPGDSAPAAATLASLLWKSLRHPRSFCRQAGRKDT